MNFFSQGMPMNIVDLCAAQFMQNEQSAAHLKNPPHLPQCNQLFFEMWKAVMANHNRKSSPHKRKLMHICLDQLVTVMIFPSTEEHGIGKINLKNTEFGKVFFQ